jgi:uncharacterized iron-regulated protein
MKRFLTFLIAAFMIVTIQAQDKPAYKLFKANGKKVSYKRMLKKLAQADIILFGEHHDNPITHWLQLETTRDLAKKNDLVLGFEMLEADNQKQVNKYLSGNINHKALDTLARLWKNYKTDYKPLVDFAKKKHFHVVASNIPRRYASKVFRGGFEILDSLTDKEKAWITPLPFPYDETLPGYVKMTQMEHMKHMPPKMKANMPKAQAVKDATMSHFILKNYKKKKLFIHYNGSYHSDNYEGIYWYLKKSNPKLNIITITTESEANPKKFNKESLNKADYIIQVAKNMTSTY